MGQFDVLGGRGQLPGPAGNAGIYELHTYVRRCTYFGELGEGDNKGEWVVSDSYWGNLENSLQVSIYGLPVFSPRLKIRY